jgi:hypothetical protein
MIPATPSLRAQGPKVNLLNVSGTASVDDGASRNGMHRSLALIIIDSSTRRMNSNGMVDCSKADLDLKSL